MFNDTNADGHIVDLFRPLRYETHRADNPATCRISIVFLYNGVRNKCTHNVAAANPFFASDFLGRLSTMRVSVWIVFPRLKKVWSARVELRT